MERVPNPKQLVACLMLVHEHHPDAQAETNRPGFIDFYWSPVRSAIPCATIDVSDCSVTVLGKDATCFQMYPAAVEP